MALSTFWKRPPRGTTTVEAAIIFPLLLLIIFGLIEYGNMFLRLQQIENVARQAARTAATPDATQAQVTTLITQMMTTAGMQSSGYTVTMTLTDPATASRGGQVTVNLQVPYTNMAIIHAPLIPVPTNVARKVVMAKEGPDAGKAQIAGRRSDNERHWSDSMKLSIVGLLVLGLFAALTAAVLMAVLTVKRTGPGAVPEPEATVLVAKHDLAPSTLIDASAVTEQKVPRSKVPEQALSTSVQAIGKVLAVGMVERQAFRKDVFVTEGSGPQLAASFPPGKRAVAISLSDAAGLDGVLYPGSVVDLILTVRAGNGEDRARSRTVLETIPVLAIERQTVIAKDAEKQDGGMTQRGMNSRRVTLLVDSRQATIIQLALSEGSLSLAMRNPMDKNNADRGPMSLAQIMPKPNGGTGWLEALAANLLRAAAARQPQAAPSPSPVALAPATAPATTGSLLKPKPAWETTIIRGATVEKVEFPEGTETTTLVRSSLNSIAVEKN